MNAETMPPAEINQAIAAAIAHWRRGEMEAAEQLCQRVLAAWPSNPAALHVMGVMAQGRGKLDLALSLLRRAAESPSATADCLSNLAEICRRKGLLAEGEAAARDAVAQDPNLVAGWNNLGIILQEEGKLEEGLACLDRLLAMAPDDPKAFNNRGNTLKRLGRLHEARRSYLDALAIRPDYAEARSNLANVLSDLGEVEPALAEVARAVKLAPGLADAHLNWAAILTRLHRHDDALRRLDALLAVAPLHIAALAARSNALRQLDRPLEAVEAARRAIAIQPADGEALNALGQALQAAGNIDEALDAFERAAAGHGQTAEAGLVARGQLLTEIGRSAEAMEAFDRALAAFPASAATWFGRAELKKFTAEDPDLARMEAQLASGVDERYGNLSFLRYALAKAWFDAGDADRAFGHLNAGAKLVRATLAWDSDSSDRQMAATAEIFTPALLSGAANCGDPSELPVFVLGMPRSGTTLVEQILASHPAIHGAGELATMGRLASGLAKPAFPHAVAGLSATDLATIGRRYLDRVEPLAAGKCRVVDKMPGNFLFAGLIRLALPKARIIHCRRDPVDTCLSCYTKLFSGEQGFTYDLDELGRFHRSYQRLMDHWRRVLSPETFIEVDYEAVVDDLEGQARRLIAFCGLEWNESCLDFHRNTRAVRTASVTQVRQPIYKSSVGRWRRYQAHLGPLLTALGEPG